MGQERLTESGSSSPRSSAQIERRDAGPPIITVTVHAADVAEATRLAREQYDALVRLYATPPNGEHAPVEERVRTLPVNAVTVSAPATQDQTSPTAEEQTSPRPLAPGEPIGSRVAAFQTRWRPQIDLRAAMARLVTGLDRDVAIVAVCGTVLAIVAWWLIYGYGGQPVAWDAQIYYDHALALTRVGLGGWADPLRTYAYPLFLAAFLMVMADDPMRVHWAVAVVQLLFHLVMAAVVGSAVGHALGKRWLGLLTYLLLASSPVLLIQTTELLTDSLSATTIGLAVAPLIVAWRADLATRRLVWLMAASLFCASLSAAIRPANAIVIVAVVALWGFRSVSFRSPSWRWLPVVVVALALPLLPQVLSNYRAYRTPHPLIVTSLYEMQLDFGATMIKYGTTLVPGKPNQLRYDNPFMPPGGLTARELWQASPLGYVATLALHGFALLDQDQPFTYVYELHPWYRWYLAVGVYLFWSIAAVGTVWAVRRAISRRALEPMTWTLIAPAMVGAAYIAVYLPTAVEVRYGTPLFLLATPAVAIGLTRIVGSVRERPRRLVAWAAGAAAILVACASLSAWITQQAPSLRG
jgi:hypothetical protein